MIKIEVKEKIIKTIRRFQFIDITIYVKSFVKKNKVTKGQVTITTKHTTTAITINENETRLLKDIKNHLNKLVPIDKHYFHDDLEKRKDCPPDEPKNTCAHLQALLMGASETLPIENGKLERQMAKDYFC